MESNLIPDITVWRLIFPLFQEKVKITQKPVDPEDPYQAPHRGLFYKTIKAEEVNRRYAVYIPDRFPPFGDGILFFAPGGEKTESFIEKSGIREIAEKKTLMFLVLESAEKKLERMERRGNSRLRENCVPGYKQERTVQLE